MSLRELVGNATPETPQDAAEVLGALQTLARLAPEMAVLLADAMDAVEDGLTVFVDTQWFDAYYPLLARFAELEART